MTIFINGTLYCGSAGPGRGVPHAPVGHLHDVDEVDASPFLVGLPSWYLVKSTMTRDAWPATARTSRARSEAAGRRRRQSRLNCMHCWPSGMRYCPGRSSPRSRASGRLGSLSRAHELQLVDARDRGVQEAEAVLAPLHLQHGVGRAVHGEDVTDEAVIREVLEERLAPPLRMRPRVARRRVLALAVVDVLVRVTPSSSRQSKSASGMS